MKKKCLAELIGTMVLVLMGCGSAVFAGSYAGAGTVGSGVGTLGVALAFGLSVVVMAYTIGGISGCHINPAITLGVFLSGRMSGKDAGMYMLFQVIGAFIGSAIIFAIVSGIDPGSATYIAGSADGIGDFATTTGANRCQPGVSLLAGFLAEVVFTCV